MSHQKPVLFGAMIDVSESIGCQIGHNSPDGVGSWIATVLALIDQIIEHDVSNHNRVLFSAFGAAQGNPQSFFDILHSFQAVHMEREKISCFRRSVEAGDLSKEKKSNIPKQDIPYLRILQLLKDNGSDQIFSWIDSKKLRGLVNNEFEAYWLLDKMQRDKSLVPYIVQKILPTSCRGMQYCVPVLGWVPIVGSSLGLVAEKTVQTFVQEESTDKYISDVHIKIKFETNK